MGIIMYSYFDRIPYIERRDTDANKVDKVVATGGKHADTVVGTDANELSFV